jgi:hypothetical protein
MVGDFRMEFRDLPIGVREVGDSFISRLREVLREKLYGVYMYGAAVFPDSGPIIDIDCHVVLNDSLNDQERTDIFHLYEDLAKRFPSLGDNLDVWYILLGDAQKTQPPLHQLKTNMHDEWWALHCAHIRAGRYLTLCGPEPVDIFPVPSWAAIVAALDYEIGYIKKNLIYPAYCISNLCRIIYSFQKHDVVVSKRFSGLWASNVYPRWKSLIEAALRDYERTATHEDKALLQSEMEQFLSFASERIREAR